MKRLPAILLPVLLLGLLPLRADEEAEPFPPEAIAPDRYEAIMKRSPFVLPTHEEETRVETTWASDFQIVSILKSGEDLMVLARKVSTGERVPIRTRENALGIRLVKLRMSPDPREVSALIAMGDVEGTIGYDPALLSSIPTPSAADNPALKPE